MKLAEALILRADIQRETELLKERLHRVVQIQEGDEPAEDPQALLTALSSTYEQLTTLIKRINRTNANTPFGNAGKTLADALVERDGLMARRAGVKNIINVASNNQHRYGRSEIKFIVTVDIKALQSEIDNLSREFREVDTAIQQLNWTVDLAD